MSIPVCLKIKIPTDYEAKDAKQAKELEINQLTFHLNMLFFYLTYTATYFNENDFKEDIFKYRVNCFAENLLLSCNFGDGLVDRIRELSEESKVENG